MNLKALILGGVASALSVGAVQAQTIIDGNSVDDIVEIARAYGSATMETQSNGDPKLSGRISGVNYWVYFMNCTENTNCEDLNFYTAFADFKPSLEVINEWNRDMRWGRAYLDSDLDAAFDFDVNLVHGVDAANLQSTWQVWSTVLGMYVEHIGYQP